MPGGLLQLSSYGAENHYLHGNPQITFFKSVFKRHTNFAMESIDVRFEGSSELSPDKTTTLKVKIPRNGDLINKMFLRVTIPDIYSTQEEEFYWTNALGLAMINYVDIFIGGSKIERLTGEYMDIYSQLNHSETVRHHFKQSIGDIPELSDFGIEKSYFGVEHTSLIPGTTDIHQFFNTRPSLFGRNLIIPLNFWFAKNNGNSLPLIALQYHDVEIEIELKAVKDLYTILKKDNDFQLNEDTAERRLTLESVKNSHYLTYYRVKDTGEISKYLNSSHTITKGKTWNLDAYLDVNYIFLDDTERSIFAQNTHEYLIDQVQYHKTEDVYSTAIIELEPFHPIKEMIFTVTRNDNNLRNEWLNLTNHDKRPKNTSNNDENERGNAQLTDDIYLYQNHWYHKSTKFTDVNFFNYNGTGDPNYEYTGDYCIKTHKRLFYNSYKLDDYVKFSSVWPYRKVDDIPKITKDNYEKWDINAFKSMEIRFNGFVRQSRRDSTYYNRIQSHLYHSNNTEQPIMTYSFALNPENSQPSGACNFSKVENMTLHMELIDPPETVVNGKTEKEWMYNVNVYLINYNILKITGGMGSLVYAN